MLNIKQRKERTFDQIKSLDDVLEILKTQFVGRKLHLKYSVERTEVQVSEFFDDKTLMIITDPDFSVGDGRIIMYGLLDKYIEIDLRVEEVRGPGYFRCSILSVRKAAAGRRDLRFKVNPEEVVATNFKFSKHTIDLTNFNIPTSIKVILDQFQSSSSSLADILRVDVFGQMDKVMEEIRKTGKTLYIQDASDSDSFSAITDDFVDARSLYGDELGNIIKKNVERGYKSIIICPLIYITDSEQSIPFAYIQLISTTEIFPLEKVLDVKDIAFKLVDRIRDANTLTLPVHQQIVDISKGGAKLRITDENLKKYLFKARGFIFDIVFKLQAPITIYGEIRYTNFDDKNNLFLGVDFAGNSSRKNEMKRFYSIMKPMEMDYKSRLMKEMKQKKKTP